jgi:glucose/arabinose dehydrogenase
MDLAPGLKHTICALFEVHEDSSTVQRIVTPLEYPGSNDKVVIRVRQRADGFEIDENGEAALYASLQGGDVESDLVQRWAQDLNQDTGVDYENETGVASLNDQRLIAPAIFQVACAAQQLFALARATSHKERAANDFKDRVASVIAEIADSLHLTPMLSFHLREAWWLTT